MTKQKLRGNNMENKEMIKWGRIWLLDSSSIWYSLFGSDKDKEFVEAFWNLDKDKMLELIKQGANKDLILTTERTEGEKITKTTGTLIDHLLTEEPQKVIHHDWPYVMSSNEEENKRLAKEREQARKKETAKTNIRNDQRADEIIDMYEFLLDIGFSARNPDPENIKHGKVNKYLQKASDVQKLVNKQMKENGIDDNLLYKNKVAQYRKSPLTIREIKREIKTDLQLNKDIKWANEQIDKMKNQEEILDEMINDLIKLNNWNDFFVKYYKNDANRIAISYNEMRNFKDKLDKYTSSLNDIELTDGELIEIRNKLKSDKTHNRPFDVLDDSGKFSLTSMEEIFKHEYNELISHMEKPSNMFALSQKYPTSFAKLLEEHPFYATIEGFAIEDIKYFQKNQVFAEYMSFNSEIKSFETGDIELKDLDDKIFTNDAYCEKIKKIIEDKLFEHFKEILESTSNDEERNEISNNIQKILSETYKEMYEKRTNYFRSISNNSINDIKDNNL